MKKRSTTRKKSNSRARSKKTTATRTTRVRKNQPDLSIGMDLGDKTSCYAVLDAQGELLYERTTPTTRKGISRVFGPLGRCRIAIEVGTHSPWISRLLKSLGHEVYVANARQLNLISKSTRKDDRMDARTLARLVRLDPELLKPIRHRSQEAQQHLALIRLRATVVEARTMLINAVRGVTKSFGERLGSCDADQVSAERMAEDMKELPEMVRKWAGQVLEQIAGLTQQIKRMEAEVAQIARETYPETARLMQVKGVGALTALTYLLTLEDPRRFPRSRDAGCYIGLRPKRRDSGEKQSQLGISKEGDRYLRQLLVQSAHYILGRNGPDSDLKRWGLKLAARGGKNAKKRAVTALARKLAVLLHRLWVSGEIYDPLRNSEAQAKAARKAAA